jgi:hypothetical protein
MNDIKDLFQRRDQAVRQNDKALFLSTQVEEISFHLSSQYLSLEAMTSEVLAITDSGDVSKVAFVKESYFQRGERVRQRELFSARGAKTHKDPQRPTTLI